MFNEAYNVKTKQNKNTRQSLNNLKTSKSLDKLREEGKKYADKYIEE